MAYASVAQADRDAFGHDSNLDSPSLPDISSPQLSPSGIALSGDGEQSADPQAGPSRGVGSLLKSLASTPSYEIVDDEDYEEPMETSQKTGMKMEDSGSQKDDTITFQSEEPPIRTASISRHLPLKHPTPDLHSLQGAFIKNVERLEESAERLSMTSSLEDELSKMRQDQKRSERQSSAPLSLNHVLHPAQQRQFSTSSLSNSIIGVNQTARIGGYSPSGYITSPTGSIKSGLGSNQLQLERQVSGGSHREETLPEPPVEGRPLQLTPLDFTALDLTSGDHPPAPISHERNTDPTSRESPTGSIQDERPTTSASNDTYRQAQSAFHDFDGVHYGGDGSMARQISLRRPPLARDSKAYREAQPGEKMIYYPAPVPVMLNLPPRLSKVNISEREKRRLQALSGIPDGMRKSAAWLADADTNTTGQRASQHLPSQLRASAFFEYPSATEQLELKNGSAVQTLDSILDAAAYAPVSAFTDHPIAGHVGKEVYGVNKSPRKSVQLPNQRAKNRRSSLSTLLRTKRSSTALSEAQVDRRNSRDSKLMGEGDPDASDDDFDHAAAEAIMPDADELEHGDDEEEAGEGMIDPGFCTAPTTLLAELQLRKEQQKRRNRTAADAFPNGMHSTLLEMDAVTQLQQKARKTKHVTLAWEDHEEADKQNFDDEDVPLGLLFPEKDRAAHANIHRPVGLLERREMEDNEPLSHRRARLRGEPLQSLKSDTRSHAEEASRAPVIEDVPGLTGDTVPETEDETLAQRAARLKLEKEKGTAGQFTEEVSSQLGLNVAAKDQELSKTPDGEETLAQRRKRLKEEALRAGTQSDSRPRIRSMHSMADILQAHPVGARSREVSGESKGPERHNGQPKGPLMQFDEDPGFPSVNYNQGFPLSQTANWGYPQQNGAYMNALHGNAYMNHVPNVAQPSFYGAPLPVHMQQPMSFYPYGYGAQPYIQDPMMGPPLNPKQRAQIDQWRQSIVQ
ncbi:hypothetical protein ABEF95_013260 [Exophiala dermatitidis]